MLARLRSEDFEDWLEEYERVSAFNHLDESAKIAHVAFYLRGVALTPSYAQVVSIMPPSQLSP